MKDYYKILGLSEQASQDDIKKAYRKLAMKYHPDHNKGDKNSEEKFKEISEAYSVLSDPQKKNEYDTFGKSDFQDVPPEDLFREFMKAHGSVFDRFFRGPQGNMSDIHANLAITLEEAYRGAEKNITVKKPHKCQKCNGTGGDIKRCPVCGGTGMRHMSKGPMRISTMCSHCNGKGIIISNPCNRCGGKGRVYTDKNYKLKIPKGCNDGSILRLKNEGENKSGDLYVHVIIKPHSQFIRKGNDLRTQATIKLSEACLGTVKEFNHLDGKDYTINVPAGTQDGHILKLKGKGMNSKGNLYALINVDIPKKLTEKQRRLFKELKRTGV